MGDKIESKKLAKNAGVSTVPGYLGEVERDEEILKISHEIGYPVMIKASAGGGGKGMRIAWNDQEALEGFKLSKDEAISSFGDGRIFIEKYIVDPRHIEFQILGDEHGNYVYLPERECSVQRRNQKVIEEAPSTAMDLETRAKMGNQSIALARSCGYTTTGTVEFLMDAQKNFYFLEMNTRLQVEHPITEEITGIDLVEQQLLIAAGHKLNFKQEDVKINGHSMEYRVYAEDPSRKFLPSIGFLKKYQEPIIDIPGKRVRIDTGVEEGSEISMYYDPMISKLITWGKDRQESMDILDRAFDEYVVRGVTHNIGFGKSILANEAYSSGNYSTAFIPTYYPNGFTGDELTSQDHNLLSIVGHQIKNHFSSRGKVAFEPTETLYVTVEKLRDAPANDYKIQQISETEFEITNLANGQVNRHKVDHYNFAYNSLVTMKLDGEEEIIQYVHGKNDGIKYNFDFKGNNVELSIYEEKQYKYKHHMPAPKFIDYAKTIMSPMPGAIVSVHVQPGDKVVDGQQLVVIEAMKMQNIIKAQADGVVDTVTVKGGDSVAVDETLITFK
jgi:propionyl-CoA carboxylase alpha chain